MHVHSKRLKFNILLTTYEILLKDKVKSCLMLLWNRVLLFFVSHEVVNVSSEVVQYGVSTDHICNQHVYPVIFGQC